MQNPVRSPRRFLATAIVIVLLCSVAYFLVSQKRQYQPVDRAQQELIAKVQADRLLGANTQDVIAFFRQQNISFHEQYSLLSGDGWEIFLNNHITASALGKTIEGQSGVLAHTSGYFGCTKSWFLQMTALFDSKGKVIGMRCGPVILAAICD